MKRSWEKFSELSSRLLRRGLIGMIVSSVFVLPIVWLRAAEPVPPGKMAFQGFLTDASGVPLGLNNPVKPSVTFRIYRNATGTAPSDIVWAEQQSIVVEQGQYTAILGNGQSVGSEPFTNHLGSVFSGPDASDRFLGVTLAGQSEIRPRIQFFATPFTQFSRSASMLVGASGKSVLTTDGANLGVNIPTPPTTALEIGGSLKATSFSGSGAQLTGVTITAARLTGTITAENIADGTLTGEHLADEAIGSAQLQDGSVGPSALNEDTVASLASQIGGIGSGAIVVSTNANEPGLLALGFVNIGPARLDGDIFSIKAFSGAPNAPSPRTVFGFGGGDSQMRQSVWTGSKWIIWGGINWANTANLGDGAILDPALGTWQKMSSINAPSARREFQTAWTGTKMIIWGGYSSTGHGDGRLYDPATDTWTTMSAIGAAGPRQRYSGIWTGAEFIVWGGGGAGGNFGSGRNDGAIYNPATDTWRSMAPSPLAGRLDHCAVWTGTEMIIQGGRGAEDFNDGARYNPATDVWTPMPFSPLGPAHDSGAVWTGTEFIHYGGYSGGNLRGGARYNPVSNTWKAISPGYATFEARYRPLVAWTGHEMIIWGGGNRVTGLRDGIRYNPTTDTWTPIRTGSDFSRAPHNLHDVFFTWTGSEFLWLGFWNDGGNNAVYAYRPPRAAYLYEKP